MHHNCFKIIENSLLVDLLLYSAILTCMQYLFCYDVMSMMQCMYDVWLCHEFCALCGITLMLCI